MYNQMNVIYIISLVMLFFVAGWSKVFRFSGNVSSLVSKPLFSLLPVLFSQLAMVIVVLIELIAPILMVYGILDTRYSQLGYMSCVSLILFTVAASILYHNPIDSSQRMAFLKNLSIIGGLGCALSLYH